MKKTLVLGASTNPSRYSNIATRRLLDAGHEIVLVGIKPGKIEGIDILTEKEKVKGVDTVTMYISPKHQPEWYDYILSLRPNRIIFNPGTENASFIKMAREAEIEVEVACTLVLLSVGAY